MIQIGTINVGNPTLTAAQFNDHEVELEGMVTSSGQTLNQSITNQQSKAAFIYGTASETMQENSPSANICNLTPVTGASGLQVPDAYAAMNGVVVSFYHSVISTANSLTGISVNIGQTTGTYLGSKYLVNIGNTAILPGTLFGYTMIRYNGGAGYWELLYSQGQVQAMSRGSTVLVAASNATVRSSVAADYVCSGANDDVTIQSAITYLSGLTNGGSLILSEGTFNITTNIIVASNVNISGQGNATILKRMSGSLAQVIQVNNAVVNFKLSNFTIDGNGGTYTPASSYGINCTNNTSNTGSVYDTIISKNHIGGNAYAFSYCVNMINCNGTAAATTSSGYAFNYCLNLINCVGTASSTSGYSYAFNYCNNSQNCTGTASGGGGNAYYAFYACTYLTNCTGTGAANGGVTGGTIAYCTSVIGCYSTNVGSGGSNGYAYYRCHHMQGNNGTASGGTPVVYQTCYADAGNAVALSAGGGGAVQADIGTYGFNTGTAA